MSRWRGHLKPAILGLYDPALTGVLLQSIRQQNELDRARIEAIRDATKAMVAPDSE